MSRQNQDRTSLWLERAADLDKTRIELAGSSRPIRTLETFSKDRVPGDISVEYEKVPGILMTQSQSWSGPEHLVLWDGDCHFCGHAVAWFRRRDFHRIFRFVPYQEAPSPPMTPELREACAKALHVIAADGQIYRAGRATLFLLEQVGWNGFARVLALPPFVWAVEIGYALVAANRSFLSWLFGTYKR